MWASNVCTGGRGSLQPTRKKGGRLTVKGGAAAITNNPRRNALRELAGRRQTEGAWCFVWPRKKKH